MYETFEYLIEEDSPETEELQEEEIQSEAVEIIESTTEMKNDVIKSPMEIKITVDLADENESPESSEIPFLSDNVAIEEVMVVEEESGYSSKSTTCNDIVSSPKSISTQTDDKDLKEVQKEYYREKNMREKQKELRDQEEHRLKVEQMKLTIEKTKLEIAELRRDNKM